MLQNFRSYHLAVEFYQECAPLKLKRPFNDQLKRSALSVVLNLTEGSAKPTAADRKRFYSIAYASFQESKTILTLTNHSKIVEKFDRLGGLLYKLSRHQ